MGRYSGMTIFCDGYDSRPHDPVALGRWIDRRHPNARPVRVGDTDDEIAALQRLQRQVFPGLPEDEVMGYARRPSAVLDWVPVYRTAAGGRETRGPSPREDKGGAEGHLWTVSCPRCYRKPEVNERNLVGLLDTIAASGQPLAADAAGYVFVPLRTLDESNHNRVV